MSQRDWMRAFDRSAFSAFAGVGISDTGTYRSPDGDDTAITYVYDESQMVDVGDGTPAYIRDRQIGLQLAEVSPEANGLVIGDDGRTWRLVAPTGERDDSLSYWTVAPVRDGGE